MSLRKPLAFAQLSRPIFLIGGFTLYALGTLIARYQGHTINTILYLWGQLVVTATQLMTHYSNEYWDQEADAANPNRTLWSGGSGVLQGNELRPAVAYCAAWIALLAGLGMMLFLTITVSVPLLAWVIYLLTVTSAWFYSSPPLRLHSTGYGELIAAVVVSGFTPAFAYALQTGTLSGTLVAVVLPLAMLQFAMLLVFEFPDLDSDREAGKRTLLVRVGTRTGSTLTMLAIGLAFALIAALSLLTALPLQVAALGLVTVPLGLLLILLVHKLRAQRRVSYSWLTFSGVALFALTSFSLTIGFLIAA